MTVTSLSHEDCVRLVAAPDRGRVGLLSVDGNRPVPLVCFVQTDGDVLIPTGEDRTLLRAAAGRPVTVEFTHPDPDGDSSWTIVAIGLAKPLNRRDEPAGFPYTSGALAMLEAFRNGLRVRVARLEGHPAGAGR
ncbi:hypothetical protein ABZ863_04795 [Saccharomonospora sp. NPDC046836]|uniref:hypothetical protein n=1 Tax=Saccharomonospora sp. NPDC046836 TaxID=3156921 RepID=UPI00340F9440